MTCEEIFALLEELGWVLLCGDSLILIESLPDNSIDAIVTDPPYGIKFMNRFWDHGVPGAPFWRQFLRVAKPGAFLVAMGGTRTFHRLICAIEDAGWEVRDDIEYLNNEEFTVGAFFNSLTPEQQQAYLNLHHPQALSGWLFGSGFPKSANVSKMLYAASGVTREIVGTKLGRPGYSISLPQGKETWSGKFGGTGDPNKECAITAPATAAAAQWEGWGTALKPAHELICIARKPLIGTVAKNILTHGTGAINIDGCRIDLDGDYKSMANGRPSLTGLGDNYDPLKANLPDTLGRWPANIILDGSSEVLSLFPLKAGAAAPVRGDEPSAVVVNALGKRKRVRGVFHGDSGSASRFFYHAKSSPSERNAGCEQNKHPTVKPIELMRYFVRLVCPPDGVVLDPFCGSGSTGIAAILEGLRFIGIDISDEYINTSHQRITHWKKHKDNTK